MCKKKYIADGLFHDEEFHIACRVECRRNPAVSFAPTHLLYYIIFLHHICWEMHNITVL